MISRFFHLVDGQNLSFVLDIQEDGLIRYELDFPICELDTEDQEAIFWMIGSFDKSEPQGFCTWDDLSKDMQQEIVRDRLFDEVLITKARLVARSTYASGSLIAYSDH